MKILTLFTAPKPFTNPHIAMIQRNAIRSWRALGDEVEILVLGAEDGLAENAARLGVKHISSINKNASGTPLISSLFQAAREHNDSPLLAYVNADILLLPDFFAQAKRVLELSSRFLLVGQRWDLDVREELDFTGNWLEKLQQDCASRGRLHKPSGSDYFVYPRECFSNIPDFAIGRAGWDNWMIYEARQRGWQTIDATESIHIIHQDHDYTHLPDGKPHYRLPETYENIRLAGGQVNIFTLADVRYQYSHGKVSRKKLTWHRFFREVEIFPLIHLHSPGLSKVFYYFFHPSEFFEVLHSKFSGKNQKESR